MSWRRHKCRFFVSGKMDGLPTHHCRSRDILSRYTRHLPSLHLKYYSAVSKEARGTRINGSVTYKKSGWWWYYVGRTEIQRDKKCWGSMRMVFPISEHVFDVRYLLGSGGNDNESVVLTQLSVLIVAAPFFTSEGTFASFRVQNHSLTKVLVRSSAYLRNDHSLVIGTVIGYQKQRTILRRHCWRADHSYWQ